MALLESPTASFEAVRRKYPDDKRSTNPRQQAKQHGRMLSLTLYLWATFSSRGGAHVAGVGQKTPQTERRSK